MGRRTLLVAIALAGALTLAALVPTRGGAGDAGATPPRAACAVACRAAYQAIARALPRDAGNALAPPDHLTVSDTVTKLFRGRAAKQFPGY